MADIRTSSFGGIPSGDTDDRPSSPVIGDTYYNGELGQLEIYNGTAWIAVSAPPLAPTIATPTNASGSDAYSSTAGKLSVVFTKNSIGGEPIQYNAYTTSGGHTASSSTSTVTLTGLTPGTAYTVYGNVSNNFGTSTNTANASAVTPSTLPEAPTIGTATSGNASATLTFTAGNSGGSSITNYKYSTDGTTYTALSPADTTSPVTIPGLTNGTAYTIRLKAVNANGDSPASGQSNSVTPSANITVDYLVVAGGGSGGNSDVNNVAGGGGAGGYRTSIGGSALTLSLSTNYTVTVGAGGAQMLTDGANGNNGGNSVFSSITSSGGGGGGGSPAANGTQPGSNGGSGGGGGDTYTGNQFGGTGNAGGYSPVEGYGGAYCIASGAGGGGGSSAAGNLGTSSNVGGIGGAGTANSITGSSVTYAGGGGGGGESTGGAGGAGGGGTGGQVTGGAGRIGTAGTANTGGGGGGSRASGSGGPNSGGSGVVILRYPDTNTISIGAGLTGSESSASGGYKRATLTAGSGNVSWS
jgi:hypothetical protein